MGEFCNSSAEWLNCYKIPLTICPYLCYASYKNPIVFDCQKAFLPLNAYEQ